MSLRKRRDIFLVYFYFGPSAVLSDLYETHPDIVQLSLICTRFRGDDYCLIAEDVQSTVLSAFGNMSACCWY